MMAEALPLRNNLAFLTPSTHQGQRALLQGAVPGGVHDLLADAADFHAQRAG
jgi:hypothetical protein